MIWSTGSNTPMNHPSSEWYLFFEPLFCILNIGSAHVKFRSIVANFIWKHNFLQEVKKINHLHVSFVELTVLHVVGYDLMYLEYTVCSKIRALDHFTIKMQFPSAKTFSNNCVFRAFHRGIIRINSQILRDPRPLAAFAAKEAFMNIICWPDTKRWE